MVPTARSPIAPPRAFSLLETMIVLVVTAVAGAIALPSLSAQIKRAREPAEVAAMHAFVSESRNLARRLNRCVVVTVAGRNLSRALYPSLTGCIETSYCTCNPPSLDTNLEATRRLAATVTSSQLTSSLTVPTVLSPVQGATGVRLLFLPNGSTPYGSNVDVRLNFESGRNNGILIMAGSGIAEQAATAKTTLGTAVTTSTTTATTTTAMAPASRRPTRRPPRRRSAARVRATRARRRTTTATTSATTTAQATARPRARGFSLLEVFMASILFLTSLAGVMSGLRTLTNVEEHQRRLMTGARLGQQVMEGCLLLAKTDGLMSPGSYQTFFTSDGVAAKVASGTGYTATVTVSAIDSLGLKKVGVVVSWTESTGLHDVDYVTYRP